MMFLLVNAQAICKLLSDQESLLDRRE